MKRDDFIAALGEIDEDLLGPVAEEAAAEGRKKRFSPAFLLVAACVAAIAVAALAISLGVRKPTLPPVHIDDGTESGSDPIPSSETATETDPGEPTGTTGRSEGPESSAEETDSDPEPTGPEPWVPAAETDPVEPATDGPAPQTEPDTEVPTETEKETVPAGTDTDENTENPPDDRPETVTDQDICWYIYRDLEGSPTIAFPPAHGASTDPGGDDPLPTDATGEGGNGTSGGTSGQTGGSEKSDKNGSIWYYSVIVNGGAAASREELLGFAEVCGNSTLYRGEMAKILTDYLRFRLADEDIPFLTVREYPGFDDVPEDHPFREEIIFTYRLGIVEPESEDRFGPDEPATAEEVRAAVGYIKDNLIPAI